MDSEKKEHINNFKAILLKDNLTTYHYNISELLDYYYLNTNSNWISS